MFKIEKTKLLIYYVWIGRASITISDNVHEIRQIEVGNWNRKLIVELIIEFAKAKGNHLTYDEKDWIKYLSR